MTLTEFLHGIQFKPYSTVVNSWDSFNAAGSVFMQLWQEPGQRVHDHPVKGAYLRVRCYNSAHTAQDARSKKVGYAGRVKAIELLDCGAKGYAALSGAPEEKRGPGAWAENANLSRVYPVLAVERACDSKDIFVILGQPIPLSDVV